MEKGEADGLGLRGGGVLTLPGAGRRGSRRGAPRPSSPSSGLPRRPRVGWESARTNGCYGSVWERKHYGSRLPARSKEGPRITYWATDPIFFGANGPNEA